MNRREFLSTLAASSLAATISGRASTVSGRAPVTITRVTLAPFEGRFHKFVAMNSYDTAPKGHTYPQTLVRIATDQGVEGIGVMGYGRPTPEFQQALGVLLGANPFDVYERKQGRIVGRAPRFADLLSTYRFMDCALLDLLGKLEGKPVWRLLGESARDRVEVYDGTLYFSDIWFRDRGVQAVVEEAQEARQKGYRGIKLKLGRGWKWMEKEAGLRRDIDVVKAVRKGVGSGMKVLVDINNGYRQEPDQAWRLLSETAEANLYLLEEPYPESPDLYTTLREKMHKAGIATLIADGESVSDYRAFEPFLAPRRTVDVLQMDIRQAGFLDSITVARMGEPAGAVSIPHNWGSQVGGLMGLQLSKAIANVTAAEDDRSSCDVIVAEGYDFRDGTYSVPDTPGMSLRIDEEVYTLKCKERETVIS